MKKIRALAILNFLALLVQLFVSWLVQRRMINGQDVGQVSDQHQTLFTPAGITFAIWGLIYLLLAAFCIYHLIMAWRHLATHPANQATRAIGTLFILNNLATAAWLYAWTHEELALSLLLIVFQLITLVGMHGRLRIYDRGQLPASKIFTQLPLSIYFGWITIATIANADVYLSAIGWDRMGLTAVSWTLLLIGIAIFITLLVVLVRRNVFYGLVVIWALAGIVIKRTEEGTDYPNIVMAAETGMILIGIVCLVQIARNTRSTQTHDRFPLAPHSLK